MEMRIQRIMQTARKCFIQMHKGLILSVLLMAFGSTTVYGTGLTLVLLSSGGGSYNYALENPPNGFFFFNEGGATNDQIMLTGMSGVTGESDTSSFASIYPTTCATATTSSTACYAAVSGGTAIGPGGSSATDFGTWTITSTSTTLGTINFSIQAEALVSSSFVPMTFTGTVQGPVGTGTPAPTPEPASLLLIGAGIGSLLLVKTVRSSSSR